MKLVAVFLRLAILIALLAPPPVAAATSKLVLCSGKVVAFGLGGGPVEGPAPRRHDCPDCLVAAHAPPPLAFALPAPPSPVVASPVFATPALGRPAASLRHARAPPFA